jgi:PAS domain S-box-containing protein
MDDALKKCVEESAALKSKLEKLQIEHKRLWFHLENTDLGFIEWDSHLHIKSLSERAKHILGCGIEDFVKNEKNGYKPGYKDDFPWINKIAEPLISGKEDRNRIEHKTVTKDGREVWCEWFNTALRDDNGKIITIGSFVQNITERKNVEESNRFKADLLNTVGQSVIATDMTGIVTFWNKAAEQTYGWSAEEAIGKNILEITPADHVKDQANEIMRELYAGRAWAGEFTVQRKNGKTFTAFVTDTPVYDKDNQLSGIIGVSSDITEHKSIELRLKKAEAIAQTGNWEVDLKTGVRVWSDEMYKMFGVVKGEFIPSREMFFAFVHPEDLNEIKEKLQESNENYNNSSFDFRWIRKDGAIRYGYSEWQFEFDQNGEPVRLFGIISDITERKLAYLERTKMINDLMQRNKDLEQFTYIVSHNLRGPVANILGLAEVINDKEITEVEKRILTKGLNESIRGIDNVVRDLNRILQVKYNLSELKEQVSFAKLIEDIKLSIKYLIDGKSIEINYDFSKPDKIFTLKSYIYSIFYNLITNSVKYRRQDIPCIIEIKSSNHDGKIELVFKDNGMGIDLQKRGGEVFGLYKRFHPSIEGKGMGLFMTKTQVETLGGRISIKSTVNEGAEFRIEFDE